MMRALMISTAILGLAAISGCKSEGPAASAPTQAKGAVPYTGITYDDVMADLRAKVDADIERPLIVPVPKDAGGGYTHERHKLNAKAIYEAGALYEQTGDQKYADYARDMLLEYAKLYPTLGLHPAKKEQSPGRMFWQNLNESWWLVYVIQGYDQIKDTLDEPTRENIETNVLRAVADFLSNGSPETFNKVHNHGTWATAAVGMTGYVLEDQELVEQALYGLDLSGKGGFLIQLDELFSPDGYYNEGPYYQRFALMPFVLFGQAIEANEPERKIFEHRDGILKKAIYSLIQQNYNGLFFPINDSIKDKGIATQELQYGVAIAHDLTGDDSLLSIAQAQGGFVPTPEGRALSRAIEAGKTKPFNYRSMRLTDGASGLNGALDVLRDSADPQGLVLVMKNTSQGLGHGHFDKLGFILYDKGYEIFGDYGAARFLNIEAKYGGHYLAENNAFAKQTIAHNALVVDGQSHFGGSTALGNQHHPEVYGFHVSDELKLASASIDTAYDGVSLRRSMAIVTDPALEGPVIIDVMDGFSESTHDYDLPFYYDGQIINTTLDVDAKTTTRAPLGTENGYQYIWTVGEASIDQGQSQLTLLKDRRFYSLTSAVPEGSSAIFAEVGANDPNFNLRRETALILRAEGQDDVSFVSVIEPHGEYNPTLEYTINSYSAVASVKHAGEGYGRAVLIETTSGDFIGLGLAPQSDDATSHSVTIDGHTLEWTGPHKLFASTTFKQ